MEELNLRKRRLLQRGEPMWEGDGGRPRRARHQLQFSVHVMSGLHFFASTPAISWATESHGNSGAECWWALCISYSSLHLGGIRDSPQHAIDFCCFSTAVCAPSQAASTFHQDVFHM